MKNFPHPVAFKKSPPSAWQGSSKCKMCDSWLFLWFYQLHKKRINHKKLRHYDICYKDIDHWFNLDWRQPWMKNDIGWKTTLDRRQPCMEKSWMEDELGRGPWMEDALG